MKIKTVSPLLGLIFLLLIGSTALSACTPSILDEADDLIKRNEFNRAEGKIELYMKKNPDDPKAMLMLAQVNYALKKPKQGEKLLNQALESKASLAKEGAARLSAVAKEQLLLANDGLAFVIVKKAVELDPSQKADLGEQLYSLAKKNSHKAGDDERALALYVMSADTDPALKEKVAIACGEILTNLAEKGASNLIGEYVDRCIKPFGSNDPKFSSLMMRVGISLFKNKDEVRARQLIKDAVELDSALLNDPSAEFVLNIADKSDLQASDLDAYITRYPDSPFAPDAMKLKAKVLIDSGKRDDGIKIYEELINRYSAQIDSAEINRIIEQLKKFKLVEDFSAPTLNKKLWTEVITSDITNSGHMKFHGVKDGVYLVSQPELVDSGSGIMTNQTFPAGSVLKFEFTVLEAEGTWSVGISINRPDRKSLYFLAGNWGNRPIAAGIEPGTYKATLMFKDTHTAVKVQGPRGNVFTRLIEEGRPPYFFTIGGRTGHDGILKVGFDNITVGSE